MAIIFMDESFCNHMDIHTVYMINSTESLLMLSLGAINYTHVFMQLDVRSCVTPVIDLKRSIYIASTP